MIYLYFIYLNGLLLKILDLKKNLRTRNLKYFISFTCYKKYKLTQYDLKNCLFRLKKLLYYATSKVLEKKRNNLVFKF